MTAEVIAGIKAAGDLIDMGKKGFDKIKTGIQNFAGGTTAPTNTQQQQQFNTATVSSDERLKKVIGCEDPIDCFAKLDAFLYKYTPQAQGMYGNDGKVNDKQNFGVMAQDLQNNPLTEATVNQDENGYLEVDGSRLSTVNTAVISELCKRIQDLENAVYGRQ